MAGVYNIYAYSNSIQYIEIAFDSNSKTSPALKAPALMRSTEYVHYWHMVENEYANGFQCIVLLHFMNMFYW